MTNRLTIASMMAALILSAAAAGAQEGTPYKGSPAFEMMKTLAGTWEGEMDMGEGPAKMTVTYALTSGGSAIIETVWAGTPNEMVTIIHDDSKKRLVLTHFCMLHNQPKMTLAGMDEKELRFELAGDADIDPMEMHMHSARFRFVSPDKMVNTWTLYAEGVQVEATPFELTRVKK